MSKRLERVEVSVALAVESQMRRALMLPSGLPVFRPGFSVDGVALNASAAERLNLTALRSWAVCL